MVLFSIIGALIGAGFASGQEIYIFFYRYGTKGIYGIALCSVLIGITIYKSLNLINNKKITKYDQFLKELYPLTKQKYLNLSHITNIIVNIFLLTTFFIMIAGFGAYCEQEYKINKIIGATILAIICYFVLIKDVKGVTKVNSIVVPILIVIILIIGILSIKKVELSNNIKQIDGYNWSINSIIYCSYNMILVIPVLTGISDYIKNKKQITIISLISSTIIFTLAMSIYLLLSSTKEKFLNTQMPALYIIEKEYPYFKTIYGVAIQISILSTAISIGISFLKNTIKNKKLYPKGVAIICIASIIISNIGFSNLVKTLFPIFGILGITQIVCLIL